MRRVLVGPERGERFEPFLPGLAGVESRFLFLRLDANAALELSAGNDRQVPRLVIGSRRGSSRSKERFLDDLARHRSIREHPAASAGRNLLTGRARPVDALLIRQFGKRVVRNGGDLLHSARSSLRIISFNPDHLVSTAQTLTSTRPIGSTTSRIVSSVMSVGTFAAFFGQLTHMAPLGFSSGSSV